MTFTPKIDEVLDTLGDATPDEVGRALAHYEVSEVASVLAQRLLDLEEGGGGGSSSFVVRGPFEFAFDTPGLNDGVAFYTPTIADLLLNAWIEVDTAFDGTTPLADIGPFVGGQTAGYFGAPNFPLSLDNEDRDAVSGGFGAAQGLLAHPSAGNAGDLYTWSLKAGGSNFASAARRVVPGKITAADPWLLVVSQDGTKGGLAVGGTQGAGKLYIVTATPVAF